MPHRIRTFSMRVVLVPLMLSLAALACNLSPSEPQATATSAVTQTSVALSDVPEVEILAPADNSEVVVQTAVQIAVRAIDRTGVTRVEMRVNGLPIDAIAAPDPAGVSPLESLLSWTPVTLGQNIVEVVAFRGNTRGNPKRITLIVRQNVSQITVPAVTALPPNVTQTVDPSCRARVNVNGLNLRNGPGTNYPSFANLALGAELPIIGTNFERSWFQVVAAGSVGWVSASFVTQLGVCSTVGVVPIPPSPTVLPGTQIVIQPTFTPFPTLFFPTQTSTVPVIVLPTLTPSQVVPPTQGQVTIGQLTSTAIFATQTALAFSPTPPPSPTPSFTPPPGVTLPTETPSATPTITPTPLLPELVISRAEADRTTVVLDPVTRVGQLVVSAIVRNEGASPAPIFLVSVRQPNGVVVTQPVVNILAPGQEEMLRFDIAFSLEGAQQLTIIADSSNLVTEYDETNNVAFLDITGVVATVPGATATETPTITPTPTETPTPIPTATFTPEPILPTETPTELPSATVEIVIPTATATADVVIIIPTETPTNTPEISLPPTETPTATADVVIILPTETPTNTPEIALSSTETPTATATADVVIVLPTETPTNTPEISLPPTETPTNTPEPVVILPTETPTDIPTFTPEPTATETPTPEPTPTDIPTATPEPTATETPTPEPTPTDIPTATPEPTATETPTPEPTPTEIPTEVPTETPLPEPTPVPVIDLAGVPLLPNFNDRALLGNIMQIAQTGKTLNPNVPRNANDFAIYGDNSLLGAGALGSPTLNLADFAAELQPAVDRFAEAFPNISPRFGACQGRPSWDCAAEQNVSIVFYGAGQQALNFGVPLEQFTAELNNAVDQFAARGIVPVLLTLPGPIGDLNVAQYNTAIYSVAQTRNVPLLNLYQLGALNPSLISGANFTAAPDSADFTAPNPDQYGTVAANIALLRVLSALSGAIVP
ncbi:MAG: hypothetical protein DYG88_06445 [Chloroflexi bacterium CFX4]|nr:hypothetical protein [Chloroflexi bacterium CFX4]MDL1922751.1 hypothetical protein [Chloroflexi bacterium CFX3]